jgi:biopolymer transport protein TolR
VAAHSKEEESVLDTAMSANAWLQRLSVVRVGACATIAIDTKGRVLALNRRHSAWAAGLICRIDVTALASVMLALVAMFVLPARLGPHHPRTVTVDLAKVSNPVEMGRADSDDALVVAITRDGNVWFGRELVTFENLPVAIRERVSKGAERRVYIRADMRARYGGVARILACVRAAGIERVAFIVDMRTPPPSG